MDLGGVMVLSVVTAPFPVQQSAHPWQSVATPFFESFFCTVSIKKARATFLLTASFVFFGNFSRAARKAASRSGTLKEASARGQISLEYCRLCETLHERC
jgi:hypothetical protein